MQKLTAEYVEIVERDYRTRHHLWLAAASDREAAGFVRRKTLEGARAIAVVSKQRIVKIEVLQTFGRRRMPERHQPIRILNRQWSQQHRIHDTKDRSVRANPQRQRDDCYRRKTGTAQQTSHAIKQVFFHRSVWTGFARVFRMTGFIL